MLGSPGSPESPEPPPPAGRLPRWQRALLIAAGLVSLTLATLGMFLPLLPTTPLILLAAFFFARGSARTHAWMLRNRVFGPIVRDWERHRCVSRRVKAVAIALVLASFTVSILAFPGGPWGRAALALAGAALVVFLARLPQRPRSGASGTLET